MDNQSQFHDYNALVLSLHRNFFVQVFPDIMSKDVRFPWLLLTDVSGTIAHFTTRRISGIFIPVPNASVAQPSRILESPASELSQDVGPYHQIDDEIL